MAVRDIEARGVARMVLTSGPFKDIALRDVHNPRQDPPPRFDVPPNGAHSFLWMERNGKTHTLLLRPDASHGIVQVMCFHRMSLCADVTGCAES
ncbi:hypothetical protein PILCRDRAFT_819252 [Piloderma croceum F 1598]|uniref:Uncharacterized protein n=1 Tax=Piloderma croceum (strain F 1598) TaxID=765440 RepID=A0A0C3FH22_PILCF|nr:hypothetical protein PILCRDRAFT_819252 [Piloderma croceum F 1598]